MSYLVPAVLAFIFGATSSTIVRWWQYKRDLWLQHLTMLCQAIEDATEIAGEYWISDCTQDESPDKSDVKQKRTLSEFRIIAAQIKIDGYWASISERMLNSDTEKCISLLNRLSDALTGGQFQVLHRAADPERARLLHEIASELIIAIRAGAASALGLQGTLKNRWQYSRRLQDAANGNGNSAPLHSSSFVSIKSKSLNNISGE